MMMEEEEMEQEAALLLCPLDVVDTEVLNPYSRVVLGASSGARRTWGAVIKSDVQQLCAYSLRRSFEYKYDRVNIIYQIKICCFNPSLVT